MSLLNKQAKLIKYVLLLLIVASLGACGFRLRGAVVVPAELKQTRIVGVAEFSPLYQELKRVLQRSDTQIVNNPDEAKSTITVSGELFDRRVITVDSQGRAAEFQLTYRYSFSISDAKNVTMVPVQTIKIQRDYRFDPNNVLAKDTEESQIKTDMVKFSVRQMMRRIQSHLKHKQPS